jgi:hypothetical protein
MRECPKCHYVDPPYWRNRLFDYEVDICNIEDVYQMNPDLFIKLLSVTRGTTVVESPYCYKVTRTNLVYHIWESLFKVRGWSPQKYYDGTGSRASALRKVNLQAFNHRQLFMRGNQQAKENGKILDEIRSIKKELEKLNPNNC